jgi:hypothetical protein
MWIESGENKMATYVPENSEVTLFIGIFSDSRT